MEFDRFEVALHGLFDDFPSSEHPNGRRFTRILDEVPGLARENNLALLNLAASMVEPGESYVEVGTYQGTSLLGAMVGNDETEFVAIDDFTFREGTRERLETNLLRFGLEPPTILEGDAFTLIPTGVLGERVVSVYYYDAGHDYEQQVEGLRMIEPWLAERALLIVDDTDWERVRRATGDYLASQPAASLLLEVGGREHGLPHWWEGMQVIEWRR